MSEESTWSFRLIPTETEILVSDSRMRSGIRSASCDVIPMLNTQTGDAPKSSASCRNHSNGITRMIQQKWEREGGRGERGSTWRNSKKPSPSSVQYCQTSLKRPGLSSHVPTVSLHRNAFISRSPSTKEPPSKKHTKWIISLEVLSWILGKIKKKVPGNLMNPGFKAASMSKRSCRNPWPCKQPQLHKAISK